MIDQLSIYTENKKGATKEILSILSAENINVHGLVNNDSAEFGTVRLLLSDTALAYKLLTEHGYLCRVGAVIGAELNDTPGALEGLLDKIGKMNININYIYVSYYRATGTPIIVLNCDDMEIVADSLTRAGYTIY